MRRRSWKESMPGCSRPRFLYVPSRQKRLGVGTLRARL